MERALTLVFRRILLSALTASERRLRFRWHIVSTSPGRFAGCAPVAEALRAP